MPIDEQSVFAAALDKTSAAERSAFLDTACGDDEGLRARVERLLAAHGLRDGILDSPLLAADVDSAMDAVECPGTVIGRYEIVAKLGEGGFGIVYKAQQDEPIRRTVALKIIKLGMDTEQVVTRFQAERQTLALMDHPHIASVYDAGATDEGRPYFVMEIVDGIAITEFCDQHQLSTTKRLQLFVKVCRAIQHAHEKGIIHRDIKPSNVLVTQQDDVAFPKVIDFGIAKATAGTEEPAQTQQQLWIGTPAYMSPEQVVMGSAHVDVRTDVYGLGVLLYELLTGRTPHVSPWNERDVSINEIRRRIECQQPSEPSRIVSTLKGEAKNHVARNRKADATKIVSLYRGDLDYVAMKALRRSPQERYESVLALARDVDHVINNEPIEARVPSLAYRARKFSQRQRAPLAIITAMSAVLLMAATVMSVSWYRQRAEQATRNSRNRERIEIALDKAGRLHEQALVAGNHDLQSITKALEAARRAETLLEVSDGNADLEQRVRGYVSRLTSEEKDCRFLTSIEKARIHVVGADQPERQRSEGALHDAFRALDIEIVGDDAAIVAEKLMVSSPEVKEKAVAALDIWAAIYCQESPTRRSWFFTVADLTDPDPWRTRLRAAVDDLDKSTLERLAAEDELQQQSPSCFILLVYALQRVHSNAYLAVLHQATDTYPNVLFFNTVLGNLYSRQASKFDANATQKAIRYLSAALALRPSEPRILNNLGMNLSRSGEHDQAVSLFRRATVTEPDFWYSWHNLSLTLVKNGDFADAADTYGEALKRLHSMAKEQPVDKLLHRTLNSMQDAHELATLPNVMTNDQWRYCHSEPQNWPSSGDADARWLIGTAPFGTSYFHPRTEWSTSEIWLRKVISLPELDADESLILALRAVARMRVYLNGHLIVDRRLANDQPYCAHLDRTALGDLHSGENRLAVHATAIHRQRRLEVALHVGDLSLAKQRCDAQLDQVSQHLQNLSTRAPKGTDHEAVHRIFKAISARKTAQLQ